MKNKNLKIAIIGMGYVGLPLAIEFGKKVSTIGFDINKYRIDDLKSLFDKNKEITKKDFENSSNLIFTSEIKDLLSSNFYIVCVPTPVNNRNIPNLSLLKKACILLSKVLNINDHVVFESTVYPGTTEEFCVPIIIKNLSKFKNNKKNIKNYFKYGYSPERINPGDKKNSIKKIYKLVSGSDLKTLNYINKVYSIITKKIYRAKSIKIAEAAKIIENCQRDINIAFMNELSVIFNKLQINFKDVLSAANTKWNFLNFKPGLVGGHCIGVDPYYLAFKAKKEGLKPNVILSGRKINDRMSNFYYKKINYLLHKKIKNKKISKILILGLTFKENVTDLRNSKVFDIFNLLVKNNIVHLYDPIINKNDLENKYKKNYIKKPKLKYYDSVILAVSHKFFINTKFQKRIKSFVKKKYLIFDLKKILKLKILKKNLIQF